MVESSYRGEASIEVASPRMEKSKDKHVMHKKKPGPGRLQRARTFARAQRDNPPRVVVKGWRAENESKEPKRCMGTKVFSESRGTVATQIVTQITPRTSWAMDRPGRESW